ncbi:tyrosine-type recombinase/integrase [Zhihengliuella halotolerans]|uniref:tyrosine-type recombinase/integrase n=1 Tax=Zhihengliuella halotolerans TaxID=370736 RepID=UPI000C80E99B|nr:site-specific integrase [Zhihengliuella halotolerans]
MARGKGEGSLFKNSRGLWEVRIELPSGLDGKRRRKIVRRKNKADAVKELRRLKTELSKTGDLATSSVTLEVWSEHWLKKRAEKLAPNTISGYRTVFQQYINPILGKRALDKITPQHVKHLHEVLAETPKDKALRELSDPPEGTEMLSSTYILLVHNALAGCLKMAVREGKLSANPCELVDRPTKRVTDEKALTLDEAVTLLRHIANDPNGAFWATYLLTGARRGEVSGLEVERVGDVLDLSWQIQRIKDIKSAPANYEYRDLENRLYLVRPKSKAGWRTPPLVEPLATILRRHIGDRKEGLVFQRDGRPWDPADVSKEWRKLLIDAGVDADVKLHGARHTVVDLLYEAGVSEPVIMEIVGHSSRAVTRSYRTRGNEKMVREALEKMSALVAGGEK